MMTKKDKKKPVIAKDFFRPVSEKDKIDFINRIADSIVHDIAEAINQHVANLPNDDLIIDIEPNDRFQAQNAKDSECPDEIENLPKVRETLPSLDFLSSVRWMQIKDLPGYVQSGIRKLGRSTFESFDSFADFSENLRDQGLDPLSEILVMSEFTHDKTTVACFAKMIQENGVVVDEVTLDHEASLGGYKAEVMVFQTASWTFKLVRDKKENGAPVNLNSIYAWPRLSLDRDNQLNQKMTLVLK